MNNNIDEQEIRAVMSQLVKDLAKINEPSKVKHGWIDSVDERTGMVVSEWV